MGPGGLGGCDRPRGAEPWASASGWVETGGQSRLLTAGRMSAEGLLPAQVSDKAYSKQPSWTFGDGEELLRPDGCGICTLPEANSVGCSSCEPSVPAGSRRHPMSSCLGSQRETSTALLIAWCTHARGRGRSSFCDSIGARTAQAARPAVGTPRHGSRGPRRPEVDAGWMVGRWDGAKDGTRRPFRGVTWCRAAYEPGPLYGLILPLSPSWNATVWHQNRFAPADSTGRRRAVGLCIAEHKRRRFVSAGLLVVVRAFRCAPLGIAISGLAYAQTDRQEARQTPLGAQQVRH